MAFLAWVSQLMYSHVSTASFFRSERSQAADSPTAQPVSQQLGAALDFGGLRWGLAVRHQLVVAGLTDEGDQALPEPHTDRLKHRERERP
jgi:hypothetical protein